MAEIKIPAGATEKRFTITKMSAYQAEQWLYRAAFALGRGVDDIQQVFSGDPQTLLRSILSVPYESAKPLLDDLLSCCTLVQGNALRRLTSAEACSAIESPLTLTKLRVESLKANFGFFFDGDALSLCRKVPKRMPKSNWRCGLCQCPAGLRRAHRRGPREHGGS